MKTAIAILVLAFTVNGCGAIFLGSSQFVSMDTDPDGATVIVNGSVRGKTPIHLKLKTNETYIVSFKKEGFEEKTYSISNHVSAGIVVLDVLFGLVPVIVDAATGSWYRLDENYINLPLDVKKLD